MKKCKKKEISVSLRNPISMLLKEILFREEIVFLTLNNISMHLKKILFFQKSGFLILEERVSLTKLQ